MTVNFKPTGTIPNWGDIIQATVWKRDTYGDRVPLIALWPGSTRLHVCSAINGNPSYCFNSDFNLSINTNYEVIVEQRKSSSGSYEFSVKINGQPMFTPSFVNNQAEEFKNVRVYTTTPLSRAPKVEINSYSFVNLK